MKTNAYSYQGINQLEFLSVRKSAININYV